MCSAGHVWLHKTSIHQTNHLLCGGTRSLSDQSGEVVVGHAVSVTNGERLEVELREGCILTSFDSCLFLGSQKQVKSYTHQYILFACICRANVHELGFTSVYLGTFLPNHAPDGIRGEALDPHPKPPLWGEEPEPHGGIFSMAGLHPRPLLRRGGLLHKRPLHRLPYLQGLLRTAVREIKFFGRGRVVAHGRRHGRGRFCG